MTCLELIWLLCGRSQTSWHREEVPIIDRYREIRFVRIRAPWKRAYATWVIIAVNVLWFLLVENQRGFDPAGIESSGGLVGWDVWHGGWYRLFSSLFVHMGLTHIILNMVSLASLYTLELFFGTTSFVILYFMSGVIGNLMSLISLPQNTVAGGASGAIIGVFGAAIVLSFKGYFNRIVRNQLLIILAINLIYDFSNPFIDNAAHLGGLATGIVLAYLMIGRRHRSAWRRILAWILAAATSLSLVLALITG